MRLVGRVWRCYWAVFRGLPMLFSETEDRLIAKLAAIYEDGVIHLDAAEYDNLLREFRSDQQAAVKSTMSEAGIVIWERAAGPNYHYTITAAAVQAVRQK